MPFSSVVSVTLSVRSTLPPSLVVKTADSAEKIVYNTVLDGWEPHYAVIYADAADELEILAHMLDMEVRRF